MKNIAALSAGFLACFYLLGCGKKGDLLQPLVRIPQKVESVKLFQQAGTINVEWINPEKYVDGIALERVAAAEIWVIEQEISAASAALPAASDFEEKGKLAATIGFEQYPAYRKEKDSETAGFSYPYSLDKKKIGLSNFIFSVRVKDRRSHESEFSNPVAVIPLAVSLPPRAFEVRCLEDKIELHWQAPAANIDQSVPARVEGYNIYRETKGQPAKRINSSLVRDLFFEDREFEFGVPVCYHVRASATAAEPFFESDRSEYGEILPRDIFPPAAPSGLVAMAGPEFITLSWEASREKDFAGYRIRRRAEGENDLNLLSPQPLVVNAFTDVTVEKGKRYRYAVSALDQNGNESPGTEIPAETFKEGT